MAKFPGNLESQYSQLIVSLVESINKQYTKELRFLLRQPEIQERFNSLRRNVFEFKSFSKKLEKIRGKILDSKIIKGTIDAMKGVFASVDKRIVQDIVKGFNRAKFPIPELALEVRPESLDKFIELNVELISTIADKQSEALELAVKKAVQGGSKFSIVVAEVESQSEKGKEYAEFVARDQVAKTYGAINKERQEAVGFDKYIWEATNDNRTRPNHRALDGGVFQWDDPPLAQEGTGKKLHPGEDFQCRCIAVPTFE